MKNAILSQFSLAVLAIFTYSNGASAAPESSTPVARPILEKVVKGGSMAPSTCEIFENGGVVFTIDGQVPEVRSFKKVRGVATITAAQALVDRAADGLLLSGSVPRILPGISTLEYSGFTDEDNFVLLGRTGNRPLTNTSVAAKRLIALLDANCN